MQGQSSNRRRDDPEIRREKILDEAIQIIGRRGYHGFTVQELAQQCGLTNGGLLYHFGSKEQLLLAVLEERDWRETAMVISIAGPAAREAGRSDSSLDAVLKLLRAIVERSTAEPELTRLDTVLQSEALDQGHPAHGYFRARETMVLDVFAKMVAPHVADARCVALQIYALLDGLQRRWLWADRKFDIVAEWDRALARLLPLPKRPHRL